MNKIKILLIVSALIAALQVASATTILYEDFEGATFPPTGWAKDSTGNCRSWVRRVSGQVFRTGASAGVLIANYAPYGNLTGTSYLKSPSLNFSSSGIESLSFYFRCPGLLDSYALASRLDTLKVEASTNGTTWTPVYVLDSNYIRLLTRQVAVRDTGYKIGIHLGFLNGQTSVYIRWILYDNYPGNVGTNRYFNIDSVYVFDRPAGIEETRNPLTTNRLLLKITPNPFTSYTQIQFNIAPQNLRDVKIYDVTGNLIRVIADINSNTIIWDGKDKANQLVAPGVYFIVLETNKENKVAKVLLSK